MIVKTATHAFYQPVFTSSWYFLLAVFAGLDGNIYLAPYESPSRILYPPVLYGYCYSYRKDSFPASPFHMGVPRSVGIPHT